MKTAIITGASRGIGKVIADKFAQNGIRVLIASKSVTENDKIPGTIYSVTHELRDKYPESEIFPYSVDIRDKDAVKRFVEETTSLFGSPDILINNAGALYWKKIDQTGPRKYDLINDVNVRGSYLLSHYVIKEMLKHGTGGHIIMHSPPLSLPNDTEIYQGKTAYMISKFGMTMTAMGISQEYASEGIAANTIWPATAIESAATVNNQLGTPEMWRKPEIIADAIWEIVNEDPSLFSGHQLIDEKYLRNKGVEDFSPYQVVEGSEPPKLINLFNQIK